MFQIDSDPDGRQYVYQAVDEMDKNHGLKDTLPANDGRMYEQPGTAIFRFFLKLLTDRIARKNDLIKK